ncbi:unnamed protein product [Spirodela intermedia]|uniref:CBF1-interacting co-repressor CIR N-terminal domain-containing protein n=1 Tax=Spirodela intermedia TaxID=51605 RepID=A0A7I8LMG7_SPIIN|nr:unnamed protein product [Spirodela intermedia]
MGGHGGLNILPQKRWNVYNFENREKVRKDEEEAAREEQIKRDDSRRRDAEFRLEQLRQARGLTGDGPHSRPAPASDSGHINLFEGLQDFQSIVGSEASSNGRDEKRDGRANAARDEGSRKDSKRKREDRPVVISPEDEKYRMGYGVAGKGVKAPWYLSRPMVLEDSCTTYERPHKKEHPVKELL